MPVCVCIVFGLPEKFHIFESHRDDIIETSNDVAIFKSVEEIIVSLNKFRHKELE